MFIKGNCGPFQRLNVNSLIGLLGTSEGDSVLIRESGVRTETLFEISVVPAEGKM